LETVFGLSKSTLNQEYSLLGCDNQYPPGLSSIAF